MKLFLSLRLLFDFWDTRTLRAGQLEDIRGPSELGILIAAN